MSDEHWTAAMFFVATLLLGAATICWVADHRPKHQEWRTVCILNAGGEHCWMEEKRENE